MTLDPPPRKVPDLTGIGGTVSAGAGRPQSSVWKSLGICMLVVAAGGPAGLAGRGYHGSNPTTRVQRGWVTAAVAGTKPQTIIFVQPPDALVGVPVTLSARAKSKLPVSFTSDTPLVCTVAQSTVA